ncbi:MAG: YlbF family regulator [Bacilli bacterium]|nr:YlbF family regulator [Bacilli bacterium]
MIEEKQNKIINDLKELDEVKRFKELELKIKSNEKYKKLISNFDKNKEKYEKEGILNKEIINLRKELFSMDEVKEYAKLENNIRLLSKRISDIISSIVDTENCKK